MTANTPGKDAIPPAGKDAILPSPGNEGVPPSISPGNCKRPLRILATLTLLLPFPLASQIHEAHPAEAQDTTDWPHYAGDQGSQRYTPLLSLTRENFSSLETAWLRTSPDAQIPGAGSDELWAGKHESTPIMAGGVLYNSTSFGQAYALDATTGKLVWIFDPKSYAAGTPPNFGFINRGLALWSDGAKQRIFLATGDSRLMALNAADGRPIANWAHGGEANLLEGLGLEVPNELYGVSSPPLVCGDAVIVGSSILEFPTRPAPFDRQGFTRDDLNNLAPELLNEAMAIFNSMDGGPLYSPPTARGRLMLPGVAASWSGAAFEPGRRYLYVPSITLGMVVKVVPIGRNQEYWLGTLPTPAPFLSNGMPMVKPPYGRITAIDMETGEHAWMTPVGRGYEQLPQFKGREMPAMGIPNRTFVVATSNQLLAAQEGINLVVGASPERNAARYQANPYMPSLKAFDLDTGELLGEIPLPGNATGAPIAYEINGKPFIVIPLGGAGLPAQHIALTLPSI